MQNIENDMDDLFRRAAEKYPLKTGQPDWEGIDKRLSASPAIVESQVPVRKNNYKKWILFLLLTGISLLIGFMILNPGHRNYQDDKPINQQGDLNKKPVSKNNLTTSESSKEPDKSSKEIKATKSIANINEKKEISPGNTPAKENKIISANLSGRKNEIVFSTKDPSKIVPDDYKRNNNTPYQKEVSPAIENTEKHSETKDKIFLPGNNEEKTGQENIEPLSKNLLSVKKKKTPAKPKSLKENGFYAGVITGPDFSKVKSGSFKGPGFSLGILAGYKINKSFFLETGFLSDTKIYSSEGNFFNEASASMPDGMIVNNLESRSKILEIPLKIGYVFYRKRNTNLFVATGIATYIMTKEKNNYNVTENGNPRKIVGLYEKNNLKMPAVFSVSAGWEHHLPGVLKIRIEPYLKLPMQGIGVGKLPVTSAGIQIGLTRQFK
ncbi:MAG: outer membrane beta-barrel protein [Ginsengibacter sp.]